MARNTRKAYSTGFNSLAAYGSRLGWVFPYLGIDGLEIDLVKTILFIHHLAVDCDVVGSTVDNYLSGIKSTLAELLVKSEALGVEYGVRHHLVKVAVRSVRVNSASRVAYRAEWIQEGRLAWGVPEYVAIASMYWWALRQGEFLADYGGARTSHLLMWSNVHFLRIVDESDETRRLDWGRVRHECADAMVIRFDSRKFQRRGQTREVPPRRRIYYPEDGNPVVGLKEDVGLCVVTLLQAWFIASGVRDDEISTRPIMQMDNGSLLDSNRVIKCLRMISERHGEANENVVIHSLKHGALTRLAAVGGSQVDIALVGGHKSIEGSRAYIHPTMEQGARVSAQLGPSKKPVPHVARRWRGV